MIPTVQTVSNPVTGVFGTGNIQWFTSSRTFIVPPGVGSVRVRMWGGGGQSGGSGGGFALRTIPDLAGVTAVSVTVGAGGNSTIPIGGTSSFGPYCSATGGASGGGVVGTGVGGDVNNSGGVGGGSNNGGGSASLFGNGGGATIPSTGGAGAGSNGGANLGGNGFMSNGGYFSSVTSEPKIVATAGIYAQIPSIDYIGTGGGAGYTGDGINGSGGGYSTGAGGIPGGGGGGSSRGGPGLVIVEW